ncbi:hypothetical protein [Micromonospora yangpuensis]|nr:hypothetical protein [Micromonospora yangpuensis]
MPRSRRQPSRPQAMLTAVVGVGMLIAGAVQFVGNGFSSFGLIWVVILLAVIARAVSAALPGRGDRPTVDGPHRSEFETAGRPGPGEPGRPGEVAPGPDGTRGFGGAGLGGTDPGRDVTTGPVRRPSVADSYVSPVQETGSAWSRLFRRGDRADQDRRAARPTGDRPDRRDDRRRVQSSRVSALVGAAVGVVVLVVGVNVLRDFSQFGPFAAFGERADSFVVLWVVVGVSVIGFNLWSAFARRDRD